MMLRIKGFTLVELVTVLMIIAVLAVAVAAPMVSRQSLAPELRKAELEAVLGWTRLTAMHRQPQTLAVYPDCVALAALVTSNGGCPSASPGSSDAVADHAATLAGDGVRFTLSGSSLAGQIRFDGLGRPSCSGQCRIGLQGSDRALALCINDQGWIHDC